MQSRDIRQSFIDYFTERGHRLYPSAPLVPHGDPTLLFTNAGMVQFKDFFLGADEPPQRRAVSVQKCLRVSGKHNDLENVGPSPRHHTFFEMLGNFSFGDYFKDEAIRFGWELVTEVWGLEPDHLWASVYEEDDEAAELWEKISSLPPERIARGDKKDNFWAMGDTGPCGPCSEIFIDLTPDQPRIPWLEGAENGRYLEIWNLVFMQFDQDGKGGMTPLPNPSIDTGAGLERVTAVLQGVASNYETDLFRPTLDATAALAGIEYGRDEARDVSMRVIADHLRAVSFLLADGVIPSNEGRGYVLRRVLRRAVRHGMLLGFEEPFLNRLVPVLGEEMGDAYPELGETEAASVATVRAEEEKFLGTLAAGAQQVQAAVKLVHEAGGGVLPGPAIFQLYDTYGLPLEVIREIAEEERLRLDEEGFATALEGQRSRSRQATGDSQKRLGAVRDAVRSGGEAPVTRFVGYNELELAEAPVAVLVRTGNGEVVAVDSLGTGEEGVAVLESTPFYAESGGQVGDRGSLRWPDGAATVRDTQKDGAGTIYHFVTVERGSLAAGGPVTARVAPELRAPTQRNHTGTHLLHAALRHVLGSGVRQAGSLVAPDRLRFDFTYHQPLTAAELERIEDLVNRWVLAAEPTRITPDRPYEEAVEAGAMALFGEKYGDRVRTVEVPDLALAESESLSSLELCGGCHVANTGEIGPFVIVSEKGIASGVRRIEALTGEGAMARVREREALLAQAAGEAGAEAERLPEEIASLRRRNKDLERELAAVRMQLVAGGPDGDEETDVDGVKVLAREVPFAPPNEIRNMADTLRSKLGSGVVVLGARDGERVSLIAAVTSDLTERVHAGRLAREIAAVVGGKGGGREDFAQAGGREADKLPEALGAVPGAVREQLAD